MDNNTRRRNLRKNRKTKKQRGGALTKEEIRLLKARNIVDFGGEGQLTKNGFKRLVIVIDALDEGFGGEESIVEFIPPHLEEHVVVLYSYRVNENVENRKVWICCINSARKWNHAEN